MAHLSLLDHTTFSTHTLASSTCDDLWFVIKTLANIHTFRSFLSCLPQEPLTVNRVWFLFPGPSIQPRVCIVSLPTSVPVIPTGEGTFFFPFFLRNGFFSSAAHVAVTNRLLLCSLDASLEKLTEECRNISQRITNVSSGHFALNRPPCGRRAAGRGSKVFFFPPCYC